MMVRKLVSLAVLVALVGVLSACGSGKSTQSPKPQAYPRSVPATSSAGAPQSSVADSSAKPAPAGSAYPTMPSTPPTPQPPDMTYQNYGINPVVATARQPVSTFGVDVDTASYTLARDYLRQGMLPPPEEVRAEEFINYFPQNYPAPRDQAVAAYVETAPNPFRPSMQLVQVSLKAREVPRNDRKPMVLTFVIDVSGSMEEGGRLELVKRSLNLLLDQLQPQDRVGIVAFTTTARDVVETTNDKGRLREALATLRPEQSTNVAEGLTRGYAMAARHYNSEANNRVIITSDGVANEGMTHADDILRQVSDYRSRSIYLSSIGVGMGNYNDALLEQIADKGNGNYYYVNNDSEGRRVFVDNLMSTMETVAKDVKVQVRFDSEQVATWRLVGYENRVLRNEDFRNDRVDSGDMGAGHAVTALYELQLYPESQGSVGTISVRYKEPGSDQPYEMSLPIQSRGAAGASARIRWTAAVAEFAGVLRGSPWAVESSFGLIRSVARQAAVDLDQTDRHRELLDMVDQAMRLKP